MNLAYATFRTPRVVHQSHPLSIPRRSTKVTIVNCVRNQPASASDIVLPVRQRDHDQSVESDFKLVGNSKFVRENPRTDRFLVLGFHHVEFWCSDATNVVSRFSHGLGMPLTSFSDLSTGNHTHASYLLQSHNLRVLFTAPYPPFFTPNISSGCDDHTASIPSFDTDRCHLFSRTHGLGVRAIAVEVEDAAEAFRVSIGNGALPVFAPVTLNGGGMVMSEVELYGDVVLRFISEEEKHGDKRWDFLPGFEDSVVDKGSCEEDLGLKRMDHVVGNVEELKPIMDHIIKFTGFHIFGEFTAEDVGTAESGLNSAVLANNDETVLIPINEPVSGKRRSQIQTYLDYNLGPGVQHIALSTDDVFKTVSKMRKRTKTGGFDFMPSPPPTYYKNLKKRVGDVLSEEEMVACEELGILVDRDDQGVLLQIFTKPVGDRPTLFLEIIQRIGCMVKDSEGKIYQKGGCGGFGKGNFAALFKSIEEYEKQLESKHQHC